MFYGTALVPSRDTGCCSDQYKFAAHVGMSPTPVGRKDRPATYTDSAPLQQTPRTSSPRFHWSAPHVLSGRQTRVVSHQVAHPEGCNSRTPPARHRPRLAWEASRKLRAEYNPIDSDAFAVVWPFQRATGASYSQTCRQLGFYTKCLGT